ncbi:hypothetical protein BFW01_g5093 [Lasiodiplodia theobromae]|uniref:DUF7888 domain-containing protein n=1 Tax=Lasiodiplodia theobromae TaxID=45133 RepID=A0A5N5D7D2_9PEZI|nr:uncharacterized protein LTHEOB_6028 [Lasiodiplodia theobromae]KAB2573531.1 hypothetical protein DBV05_g7844 [Lasiodiplodia theobromae]KAF4544458.1 hypothetical protein LTHEOB_6028 [Lasiodiplodia theobromae]KAF9634198.1 hypothetical protein BFW01_g5093 [Lasiodiplodia theobromae]
MRFTSVAIAALAVAVNASPVPLNTEGASNVQYGQAIGEAVEGAIAAVNGIKNWNKKREAFVKALTQSMWDHNPDPSEAVAAICYNDGYALRVPTGMLGLRSESVSSGPLHTSYDCFYMKGNNAFWSQGDGGSVNLWTVYNGNRCSFDHSTSDLTCN